MIKNQRIHVLSQLLYNTQGVQLHSNVSWTLFVQHVKNIPIVLLIFIKFQLVNRKVPNLPIQTQKQLQNMPIRKISQLISDFHLMATLTWPAALCTNHYTVSDWLKLFIFNSDFKENFYIKTATCFQTFVTWTKLIQKENNFTAHIQKINRENQPIRSKHLFTSIQKWTWQCCQRSILHFRPIFLSINMIDHLISNYWVRL